MNYEEMSDFELNVSVAEALRVFWYAPPDISPTGGWEYAHYLHECNMDDGEAEQSLPDYCNNPADAWPIVHGNGIGSFEHDISGCGKTWTATTNLDKSWLGYGTDGFDYTDKNPLRAAMIVFLMMHEQSHNCPSAAC